MPSGLELSELDHEFRDGPHARLDRLRRETPRYIDPASGGARLFLTRYADVRAAVTDRTLTRDAAKAPERGASAASGTLLAMEGEDHLLGRRLVARALDTSAVESQREAITAIVDEALDALSMSDSFDFIAEFAIPVPMRVITGIMGLPQHDIQQLRAWAGTAGVLTLLPKRTCAQDAALVEAVSGLQRCVFEAIAARRAAPGNDLISELLAAEVKGRKLSDEEIGPLCFLVLVAGSITTTDLVGNAVMLLLQHPEQLSLLRERPELIGPAIEEVLRHDPPVSAVARYTSDARELFGCPMPPRGTVKASLLAANRDPEMFPDPHAFRIERGDARHVSFGGGSHACLGARLAKLEAEIAVARLLARFPDLRIDDASPAPRKTCYGFRGYESAWLRVG